jgi:hypothetical protein
MDGPLPHEREVAFLTYTHAFETMQGWVAHFQTSLKLMWEVASASSFLQAKYSELYSESFSDSSSGKGEGHSGRAKLSQIIVSRKG